MRRVGSIYQDVFQQFRKVGCVPVFASGRPGFVTVQRCSIEGWLPPPSRDDTSPAVPKSSLLRRPMGREQCPESTCVGQFLPADEPHIPGQVFFQSQIQVMRQLFETHLPQADLLAMEHRVGVKEHEAQD
jgi:hypothetical protein